MVITRLARDCGGIISWNISNTSVVRYEAHQRFERRALPRHHREDDPTPARDELKLFIPKKLFFICCLMFYLLHLFGIINSEAL